jgi:hypothetical protein
MERAPTSPRDEDDGDRGQCQHREDIGKLLPIRERVAAPLVERSYMNGQDSTDQHVDGTIQYHPALGARLLYQHAMLVTKTHFLCHRRRVLH